ncbi:hypothetical protein BDY24DRAFT_440099 [Mrakia frigida]|uniref:uncharacterized protein n=1 Tax=Mrakia frigida TaxID=29902 RepID=UPI003FCC1D8B
MLGRSKSLKKKASTSDLLSTQKEEVPTVRPEDEKEPLHAPTGLVNDGNTCYLNSVFQSLIHTPPLSTLLTPIDCPDRPWMPAATCEVDRQRHPAFMAERNLNKDLMPLAASFIESSGRSWRTELAGLEVTKGDRKGQGLKTLLYTISKKYEQYGDYDQQDAHELLRHLLDSMRMEEVDVIKRLHPKPTPLAPVATSNPAPPSPASNISAQPSLSTSSTPTSPLPSINTPEPTEVGSLDKRSSRVSFTDGPHKDAETSQPLLSNVEPEAEPHDMLSFVDLLFGGRLASMIVCETCKSVSHTYEDFMDLSMGLPQEEPRERKRDRLMSIARKLGGKSSKPDDDSAVASDEEDEGSDHKLFGSRRLTSGAESNPSSAPVSRRGSTVSGNEGGANLGRRGSIFAGLASLSITRKKSISSRRSSAAQSDRDTPGPSSPSLHPSDHGDDASSIPPISSAPTMNSMKSPPPQFSHLLDPKFPKVKSSQAAYIRRILGSAPNPNPLAALKLSTHAEATVGGWLGLPSSSQNGLMDSLRQFTQVEVLEGENSFACKKCWRWENPRSDGRPWRRGGETGNDADDEDEEEETDLAQVDRMIEPISEAERLAPLPESIVSAPTSAGTTPFLSAVDLSASTVSAPDVLTTPINSPYPPLSFQQKSGFDSIKVDTSFPDDPTPDTPGRLGVDYGGGQVIPTINTIPFSPESETPPDISTTAPSPAPSLHNGVDKSYLAAPTKRPTNLRPSASRGHSYTRHVNPAFKDGSDSENSDASSTGSFASSDDDGSSLGSGEAVEQSPSSTTAALPGGEASKPVASRPKPTRKKSSRFVMRRAFKRYLIVNPPPILVFHLKRFELITGRGFGFGGFAGNFKKIDTFISFPLVIDVAPFLAPARIGAPLTVANSSAKKRAGKEVVDAVPYHLSAIVVHLGTMGQGHYVSYVLSSPDDPPPHHTPSSSPNPPASPSTVPLPLSNVTSQESLPLPGSSSSKSHHHPHFRHGKKHPEREVDPRVWWYCSDTLVQQVPVEEVLKAKAYLLFFQKTQTTV